MARKSTLKPGDVVNRTYELTRFLGEGYSGAVWEARHLHLPASFALKMMHEEDRDNEHKASRFRAEAATLFRLQHENVVRIWDANETAEGLFFIVMELLAGETLTQRLTRGRLHPLRALKYAYDVACGLDAAHEIGVVHRDVKPDNLFITREDVIKLLDFTAAKFFLAGLRTTEPAARVGTVAFMSPEHLDGTTTDARLDQYSLALCIYCMMRGKHPFERHFANQFALMKAQSNENPEPLAKVAGLPAWIDEMLAPALSKNVARRYTTMAHFAQAIHEAMRRLAREMREGELAFNVPLGEPPIDVDTDDGARVSQQIYVEPEEAVRHVTAPVMPGERVSVAPDALPDAPDGEGETHFDRAVTAPLTTAAATVTARSTTAPVHTTAATVRIQRPARSRLWLAPLALVLATPAVAGLVWRGKMRLNRVEIAVSTAASLPPSTAAEPAPSGSAGPRALEEPMQAAPAAASAPTPALPARKVATNPPARPQLAVATLRPPTPDPRSPAAEPPPVQPPPQPAPSAAPNRVFGTDD